MRNLLNTPVVRWSFTVLYTAILIVLLVQPGNRPVIGPNISEGDPSIWRELFFSSGHLVLVAILTVLWWWTLRQHVSHITALVIAVIIALIVGEGGEYAQNFVAQRSASTIDLVANAIGALGAGAAIFCSTRMRSQTITERL